MNKQIRGLHEAAYLLAIFAFLSQILALIRDRAFAHFFGAGAVLDAYFAAFRIPDIVFALLALFISSFALVPLIAERGGPKTEDSRELIGSVLIIFGFASVIVGTTLYFYVPSIIPFLFPGFSGEVLHNVTSLSRIMLLQPILLGFSSVMASVMQVSQRFFLFALAPIFYNIGIILGVLFLYPTFGIIGLAWGVVLGALLHLVIQSVPAFLHERAFIPIVSSRPFQHALRVARLSLPRSLALASQQVLLLVFVAVASFAALGSVSVLSFAFNLQSVPLSIIGVSYAAALFPSLSLLFAKGDYQTYVKEVWTAVRHIILWITPAIALMIVLRAHIVRVILGSGEFTWADTRLTSAVLAGFVISLIAQAVILIFSRAYYAAGRSLEPIIVNVSSAILSGALAWYSVSWFNETPFLRYFLENLFRISDIPGSEIIMIALSYSLVMLVSAGVFAVLYAIRFGFEPRTVRSLLFSFSASVIGASTAYGALQFFGPLLPTDTFLGIFTQGVVAGGLGILAWAGTLMALQSRDFQEAFAVFYRLAFHRSI